MQRAGPAVISKQDAELLEMDAQEMKKIQEKAVGLNAISQNLAQLVDTQGDDFMTLEDQMDKSLEVAEDATLQVLEARGKKAKKAVWVAGAAGATIGLLFGGPVGAALGMQLGAAVTGSAAVGAVLGAGVSAVTSGVTGGAIGGTIGAKIAKRMKRGVRNEIAADKEALLERKADRSNPGTGGES